MRVLLVHNFYQLPGGEDRIVREEFDMLARAGIVVDLFSVHNDEIKGVYGSLGAGLQVIYHRRARQELAEALKKFAPDVVHIHNFFPRLSPSILDACQAAGVPTVMTLHNFRILSPGALLHPSERVPGRDLRRACWWTVPRRVYRNSAAATLAVAAMIEFHKWAGTWNRKVSRFVALTQWGKERFVEGGLPADRIVVKPNCVARPPVFGAGNRRGGLFVGRLDEAKGIRTLLSAWRQCPYPLKIIGDGPLNTLVKQHAGGELSYLGPQPREVVQREMRTAKFLVLPSSAPEMFPVAVIEAFSNRLPVICSDLPALEHVVEVGVTGLKFAAEDAEGLARHTAWAVAHSTALDDMGRRAGQVYEARYTPEVNVARLTEIYTAAMEAAPANRRSHLRALVPLPRR